MPRIIPSGIHAHSTIILIALSMNCVPAYKVNCLKITSLRYLTAVLFTKVVTELE